MENSQLKSIQKHLEDVVDSLEKTIKEGVSQLQVQSGVDPQHDLKEIVPTLLNAILNRDWERLESTLRTDLDLDLSQQVKAFRKLASKPLETKSSFNDSVSELMGSKSNAPVQQSHPPKSKGLMGKLLPFLGKKDKQQGNYTPMILPQSQQKYHFDKQLGRYVFEGEAIEEEAPAPPPPKREQIKKAPTGMKLKSEMESMTAPPAFNRNDKRGTKEKPMVRQANQIPHVLDHSVTFQTLRQEIGRAFSTIPSIYHSQIPARQDPPIQTTDTDQELLETVQLMKESYQMLIGVSQWSRLSLMPPIFLNPTQPDRQNHAQQRNLKKRISQLEQRIRDSESRARQQLHDLQESKEVVARQKDDQAMKLQSQIELLTTKYQAQLLLSRQHQEKIRDMEQENQRLSGVDTEIQSMVQEMTHKDHTIQLLKSKSNLAERMLLLNARRLQLGVSIDSCLEQENSLLQRIKSKHQRLSASTGDLIPQCQVQQDDTTSSRFLEMSHLVDDMARYTNLSVSSCQAGSQRLSQQMQVRRTRQEHQKSQYQAKISSLKSVVAKQKAALDSCRFDSNSVADRLQTQRREKLKLEKEIQRVKQDFSFEKGLIEQSNNKNILISKKSETQSMQIQQLNARLQESNREKHDLEQNVSQLTELVQKIDNERERLSSLRDTESLRAKNEGEVTSRQLQQAQYKNQQLLSRLAQCQQQSMETAALLEELDRGLGVKDQQIVSLVQTIKKGGLSNQQLRIQVGELQRVNVQLSQTTETMQGENQRLQGQMEGLVEEMNGLRVQVDDLQEKTRLIPKKETEIQQLNRVLLQVQGQLSQLQRKQKETQDREKELNNHLQMESERHSQQISAKQYLIDTLNASLNEHQQAISRLSHQLSESTAANETQSKRESTLAQEFQSLKETNNNLNKQMEQRQELINALEEEISQLQATQDLQSGREKEAQEQQSRTDQQAITDLRQKLQEQQFQLTQTKQFYSKKLDDCESRLGELLEEKQNGTLQAANLNSKYQSLLDGQRDTYDSLVAQLKLDRMDILTRLSSSEEKLLRSQKEVQELLMALQESNGKIIELELSQTQMREELRIKQEATLKSGKDLQASTLMLGQLNEYLRSMKEREGVLEEKLHKLEVQAQSPKQAQLKKLKEKVQSLELENEDLLKQKVELMRSNESLVDALAESASPFPIAHNNLDNPQVRQSQPTDTLQKLPPVVEPIVIKQPVQADKHQKAGVEKKSGLMSALSTLFLTEHEQKK